MLNYVRSGSVQRHLASDSLLLADIAASFQSSVVDVLVRKTERAIIEKGINRVALSGGVAANSALREKMGRMGHEKGAEIFAPSVSLCTDNAAMIAAAAYHYAVNRNFTGLDLNPRAYLPL